jgi:hypothetical protein
VLIALERRLTPKLAVRAGYRFVEGGADNDEVYTFAWIHYATVGVTVKLQTRCQSGRGRPSWQRDRMHRGSARRRCATISDAASSVPSAR